MAISVTNIGVATNTMGLSSSISSVTVPSGAEIIVAAAQDTNAIGTVSDSVSNTYTKITDLTDGNGNRLGMFYAENVTALSSGTITYNKNGTVGSTQVTAFYATGLAASGSLDSGATASASGSGASVTATATSGSPAGGGELFVGISMMSSTAFTSGPTQSSGGWSTPFNNPGLSVQLIGGNLVNAGSGTEAYSPTAASSMSFVFWATIIAAFKPASGAASPTEPQLERGTRGAMRGVKPGAIH